MNRSRIMICFIAVLVCFCCLFTACGKSSAGDAYPENGQETVIKSETLSPDRKIVVRARYSIETLTFDETLKQIEEETAKAGGYISESNVSPAKDGSSGQATMILRIPSTESDNFMTILSGVGNVTNANVTKTDVTLTYDDVSARVAVLKAEQTKLLELIDASSDTSEILRIRAQYSEVTQELSSYEAQLKSLENSVSYATFTVSLYDVKSYSDKDDGFFVRFGRTFGKSFSSFVEVLGNVLIVLVYLLPYLLIAAVIIVVVILLTRKNRKNRGKNTTPPACGSAVPMRFGTPGNGMAPDRFGAPIGGETNMCGSSPTDQDSPLNETPHNGESK